MSKKKSKPHLKILMRAFLQLASHEECNQSLRVIHENYSDKLVSV